MNAAVLLQLEPVRQCVDDADGKYNRLHAPTNGD